MRASSGNGGGAGGGASGAGGARDNAPWPRPLRVLAMWYDLTCVTQAIKVSPGMSQIGATET
jgi:hypothetical protein